MLKVAAVAAATFCESQSDTQSNSSDVTASRKID